MSTYSIIEATPKDCKLIYDLAVPTWKDAYSKILTDEQIGYMLAKMYSESSLTRQMNEGHIFFIALQEGVPSGFISFCKSAKNLYILEKLYILPQKQGTGAGRFLVQKAEEHIRQNDTNDGDLIFELNVNRNNKAVQFYERLGFHINREVDEDIGNGFYKNDYIMQKRIENG